MQKSTTTALPAKTENGIPVSYSLQQNYPNPFNPEIIIEFNIPVRQKVRLDIFNTLGERVVTADDGQLTAGTHAYRFDGHYLASGVYYYRISAGKFIQTRKMILLR